MVRGLKLNEGSGGSGSGADGSAGSEEATGKGKEKGAAATAAMPSVDDFLAANPEFRARVEAGDGAVRSVKERETEEARKSGDTQKLLTKADEEKKAAESARDKAEHRAKAAERKIAIREHIDGIDAKDLKASPGAVYELAAMLDAANGGRGDAAAVVKQAIEKLAGWGAQAAPETAALGGSATGPAGEGGQTEEQKREEELIELGARAMKSGASGNDRSAYERAKEKFRADFKKIPEKLTAKITDKVRSLAK